jgi:hypothetical protein
METVEPVGARGENRLASKVSALAAPKERTATTPPHTAIPAAFRQNLMLNSTPFVL